MRDKQPGPIPANRCAPCFNRTDQRARHLHFLALAREGSLHAHLQQQYGDEAERSDMIRAITRWAHEWLSQERHLRNHPRHAA